jgi:hypothetical protein
MGLHGPLQGQLYLLMGILYCYISVLILYVDFNQWATNGVICESPSGFNLTFGWICSDEQPGISGFNF